MRQTNMSEVALESKNLEILVSTMNQTSLTFLEAMFPNHKIQDLNILIINQTEKGKELSSKFNTIRVINAYTKGLSLSRNLAIENAKGSTCLIADDDVEYLQDFENTVLNAFNRLQEASIIRFKIGTFTKENYKSYPNVSKKLIKRKDIVSSSSIEIAFKREDIVKNKISFNPLFGLGSYFTSGEEYLFLKDVLQKKLQIYFENETIVKHKFERSTSNMASENFVKSKAAIYYYDYKNFGYIVLLKFVIFLLRKRMISFNDFIKIYKVGLIGIKTYKNLKDA
jgi:hypothetical protein